VATRAAVAAVEQALGDGDALVAYDLASSAIERYPADAELRYLLVLSLARSGSPQRAEDEYRVLLSHDVERGRRARFAEDVAALGARLTKDRALAACGVERRRLAASASTRYEDVHRRFDSAYACANAATLALVARRRRRANALADETLTALARRRRSTGADVYWDAATEAEAALVGGDLDRARAALERAARAAPGTGMIATTRRQLTLVCAEAGIDDGILATLALPMVVHYAGHLATSGGDPRFSAAGERRIRNELATIYRPGDLGWSYGSLASGGDIVIAETLLGLGAELNVVLPFAVADFERVSVQPAGPVWTRRFRRCLAQAVSVLLTTDSDYAGDTGLFDHCSRVAMGKAIARATSLATGAEQLVVWDGRARRNHYGTARDVAAWRHTAWPTRVINVHSARSDKPAPPTRVRSTRRRVRAVLFADFKGVSRLYDDDFTVFVRRVLVPLGRVLDRYGQRVQRRMSWGDALQIVFADTVTAASCALDLQAALGRLDLARLGLPGDLGLRVSVHAGPVLSLDDPIRQEAGFFGRELTRAARIEPRTPEGSVYVTEIVAALLALEPDSGLRTEYVGRVTTAKEFETIPMYVLTRV
jgi:adenylate cyclase